MGREAPQIVHWVNVSIQPWIQLVNATDWAKRSAGV